MSSLIFGFNDFIQLNELNKSIQGFIISNYCDKDKKDVTIS